MTPEQKEPLEAKKCPICGGPEHADFSVVLPCVPYLRNALTSAERELEAERVRYQQACEGRAAFMGERNKLREELEAEREKSRVLAVSVGSLQSAFGNLGKENDSLRSELASLRGTPMHKLLSKMKTELEAERDRHAKTNEVLRDTAAQMVALGDSLRSELEHWRREFGTSSVRVAREAGEKLRSEVAALRKNISSLNERLRIWEKDGPAAISECERLRAVIDSFTRVKNLPKPHKMTVEEALCDCNGHCYAARERDALQEKNYALRAELSDTERCRARWMGDCAKMEKEANALKSRLAAKDDEDVTADHPIAKKLIVEGAEDELAKVIIGVNQFVPDGTAVEFKNAVIRWMEWFRDKALAAQEEKPA